MGQINSFRKQPCDAAVFVGRRLGTALVLAVVLVVVVVVVVVVLMVSRFECTRYLDFARPKK